MTSKNSNSKLQMYPELLYQKLEFDHVIKWLESKALGEKGRLNILAIKPSTNIQYIEIQLKEVDDFKLLINNKERFPDEGYFDIDSDIERLRIQDSILSLEQIWEIYYVLLNVQVIEKLLKKKHELYPQISERVLELDLDKSLIKAIEKIMDDNGELKNNASPALQKIRTAISKAARKIDSQFDKIAKEYAGSKYLADERESFKNGRRVLAVMAEHKRKIAGAVHSVSSGGRISFIEPSACLELNNVLVELQQEEQREIQRILKELTSVIRPHADSLQSFNELLAHFDVVRAKALLAIALDANRPKLSSAGTLKLRNAYHPWLLYLNKQQKKETVSLNVELDQSKRMLVISGPNAGGKSVAMKTIGLIQLMIQSGLLVPVDENSDIPIFKKIMVDIGDEQSLENDLSTYSSRLQNMKYFLAHGDVDSLILMDELGTGTDPRIGGSIAETLLEGLIKKNVMAVITSHYSNIKAMATEHNEMINGSMAFDETALKPLYQLQIGQPGSSYALEMAQNAGLSKSFLKSAKAKSGKLYEVEHLMQKLQGDNVRSAIDKMEIEKSQKELEKHIVEAKASKAKAEAVERQLELEYAKKMEVELAKLTKQWERSLQASKQAKRNESEQVDLLKQVNAERVKVKSTQQKITQHIVKHDKSTIKRNDLVLMKGSQSEGTVLEVRKSKAVVNFNGLKMQVNLSDLIPVQRVETEPLKKTYHSDMIGRSGSFEKELDLRGQYVEDAMRTVELFLDEAMIANVDELRIIHGTGTGALKRAIHPYLRKHTQVEEFHHPEQHEGGQGVTIVVMK